MRKLTLALILVASTASAQNVINPRFVEFTPSADHNVTLPGGQPAVSSYEIRWYASGASAPLSTASIGKPTPDASNKCMFDVSTLVIGIPVGSNYTARLAAIGPGGEGVSTPSNPFDVVSQPAPATNVILRRSAM